MAPAPTGLIGSKEGALSIGLESNMSFTTLNATKPDPAIDRPVFLLGTGRSGTTLLQNLLAFHPDFAWFSNYSDRFPRWPLVAMLARVHDLPLVRDVLAFSKAAWIPRPRESYAMLNHCTDSTFTAQRMLDASAVDARTRRRYRGMVKAYLRLQGKSRFLQKHTGFARIRYLRAIFPDALFIHMYRDGRAVASSMNRVDWWNGDLGAWWWGEMSADCMADYLDSGKEPVVLAGIVWKTLMDLIEEECSELPADRLLRVRYDRLVAAPLETMDAIRLFCGLRQSARFDARVRRAPITDMDTKWSRVLSREQRERLKRCLGTHLEKYGFADSGRAQRSPLLQMGTSRS